MPVMDGLTLIREARRLQPTLKVIIITGYSTESSAIEAVNLGVVGYLVKPFRVPQVLAAVGAGPGRRKHRNGLQPSAFGLRVLRRYARIPESSEG